VKRVNIDPSVLAEGKSMVEDLVAAAINDAVRRVEQVGRERLAGVASGLNLPPGLKLPF
jgi:DNA-binding protein YbaB